MKTEMTREEFITERTRIISEMLDNPDEYGIYPTTKCFEQLDALFDKLTPPSPSSATAEEISEDMYVKAEVFLQYKDVWNHPYISDRENKTGYEVTFLIAEFAAHQVAEAAKDCYPKEFIDFVNDNFYWDKAFGGYVPTTIIYQGNPIKNTDELYKDWKENEQ
jgi:hypothetical protein